MTQPENVDERRTRQGWRAYGGIAAAACVALMIFDVVYLVSGSYFFSGGVLLALVGLAGYVVWIAMPEPMKDEALGGTSGDDSSSESHLTEVLAFPSPPNLTVIEGEREFPEVDGGRIEALKALVSTLKEKLNQHRRAREPLVWALAMADLGDAYRELGERVSALKIFGQASESVFYFREAIAAYRRALGELTKENGGQDWAKLQANLGKALYARARREELDVYFEEAIAAFSAALEVLPKGSDESAEVSLIKLQAEKEFEQRKSALGADETWDLL